MDIDRFIFSGYNFLPIDCLQYRAGIGGIGFLSAGTLVENQDQKENG
jgi:hypothetical protein